MRAIMLVAGRGSRLRNLTNMRPKCLVPFRGRPLLELSVERLKAGGVEKFTFVAGYRSEAIEAFIETHEIDAEVVLNRDWDSTNMVQSLFCAADRLAAEPCIVSYGDIFFESGIVRNLISAQGDLVLAYDHNGRTLWERRFKDPLSDIENFRIGTEGRLIAIGGRVQDITTVQGQYMGLFKLTPTGLAEMQDFCASLSADRRRSIDVTSTFSALLGRGTLIRCVPNLDPWGELDSPEDIHFFEASTPLNTPALERSY
ncbi:NTP transferase domain-containing protein [Agrobacterium vitis]